MEILFFVTISLLKQSEKGLIKRANEKVIISAYSFTEAETRANKEYEGEKEFKVKNVSKAPIDYIIWKFIGDSDIFWKARLIYTEAADDGKLKKFRKTYLYNARDAKQALARIEEEMIGWVVPVRVDKMEEISLVEAYRFEKPRPAGFRSIGETEEEE